MKEFSKMKNKLKKNKLLIFILLFSFSISCIGEQKKQNIGGDQFDKELARELERELEAEIREESMNEVNEKSYLFQAPYDVEFLLFERPALKIRDDMEIWPVIKNYPDFDLAKGELNIPNSEGSKIILLPETEYELNKIMPILKKRGFIVHSHQMWRQDIEGRKSKAWYRVGTNRLDGIIRISKGRYLHLDADLILDSNQEMTQKNAFDENLIDTNSNQFDLYEPEKENSIQRIKLHRKMRGGEIHYIDHPKIGVLIRSNKVLTQIKPTKTDKEINNLGKDSIKVEKNLEQKNKKNKKSLPSLLPDPS